MADRMGDVAAVDSYDPFAAEQFVPQPIADALPGIAQADYAKLTSGRSPDTSPVLYPMPGGGITQQDMDRGIGIGMGVSGGGLSITKAPLFHGSPETNLKVLNESVRGPLGPGVYTSPAEQIAGSYGHGGKVYELPKAQRDIYQGAGHRTDEEWFGFKDDKKRLLEAAAPEKRQAVSDVLEKMWSGDGYPTYQRLRNIYGGDEGAQNLYKNAGFQGISGLVDGPETLLFGPQSLMPGIKAYHSSPHDFDKFDLSKIGTGEGAQVYGHGLYFAENPAVSGQGGQYWQQFKGRALGSDPVPNKAFEYLQSHGFDREAAANSIDKFLQNGINKDNASAVATHTAARDLLRSGGQVGPRTYEVNINADPAHFLDWDKPLKGQPAPVRDLLAENVNRLKSSGQIMMPDYMRRFESGELGGEQVYRGIGSGAEKASAALNEAGIPGIKYLDEGSRPRNIVDTQHLAALERHNGNWPAAVDEIMRTYHSTPKDKAAYREQLLRKPLPTSNYVVFNPAIIDIMKKYGIAGAAAPVGMGALAAQDQYETQ